MEPDRDGDRVLMTKKAKQEQFIMDSPDLNADQKRWLMGRFLPEDTVHRDYSSPHTFIISGLKEPQQKLNMTVSKMLWVTMPYLIKRFSMRFPI